MNIREHIEAGHYPTDDKGRALVPTRDAGTATIYETQVPGSHSILATVPGPDGHAESVLCNSAGQCVGDMGSSRAYDLLPPPPRKVKVTAWAVLGRTHVIDHFHEEAKARAYAATFKEQHGAATVIELTGEYEEPWS